MTLFLRLLDTTVDRKAATLLEAIRDRNKCCFDVAPETFGHIHGSPFAYWISSATRAIFSRLSPLESGRTVARRTNGTTDDGRWIRAWWEVDAGSSDWIPHAKGGRWAPYYDDLHLCIAWDAKRATYPGYLGTEHRPDVRPASLQYFFRPGLTWPRRTNGLSFRLLPNGSIFGDKGPAIFNEDDDAKALLMLAAVCNSKLFRFLVSIQLARTDLAQSFEAGIIQSTPVPDVSGDMRQALATLARRAWALKRMLDVVHETSHSFLLPAQLLCRTADFDPEVIEAQVNSIQAEIDDLVFHSYGIEGDDRASIDLSNDGSPKSHSRELVIEGNGAEDEDGEDSDETGNRSAALLSWAVGVALGRFDCRLATGERAMPPEPEPFDPLPHESPGMVPDGDPPFMPCHGVLVDDLGHKDDFVHRVTAVYERVSEPTPDAEALRRTLARDFFATHIKMYSKSRRKAPIYWQLATPSASYSVWLYIHAFSKDTVFRVQNDYVAPKLSHEQRKLEGLRVEAGPNPSSAQRKTIAAQETFVEELQAFLDEVKRVAPLWNPDLDDGVIINFAPLWRLVPQHKPWQKELKAAWDALCAGTYDWAHLAVHLWPERVVPKCATDRSLAIAHGLEDALWFEDEDGKWKPYERPARPIDELVRERSSPAVKAALQSLLDAPIAASASRRGRRGTSATNNGGGR